MLGLILWLTVVGVVTGVAIHYYVNQSKQDYRMWALFLASGKWTQLENRLTIDQCWKAQQDLGPKFPDFRLECYRVGTTPQPENMNPWPNKGGKVSI